MIAATSSARILHTVSSSLKGSVISHHSSPSRLSRELTVSTEPPASPPLRITHNHQGNYYQETHSTPIKANSAYKEEWHPQSPPATGYSPSPSFMHRGSPRGKENGYGHKSPQKIPRGHWPPDDLDSRQPQERRLSTGSFWGREQGWKEAEPSSIPEFIPEEDGVQLYPNRQRHHSTRATPSQHQLSLTQ